MKKKLLAVLCIATILMTGCGSKEGVDESTQPDTQPTTQPTVIQQTEELQTTPEPTTEPTPTPVPDDAITSLMIENYLASGDGKVEKLLAARDKVASDEMAYAFDFDLALPKSLALDSPFSTLSVIGEFQSMGEEAAKLEADIILDRDNCYTVELIANSELELFFGLPEYSDTYAKIPLEINTAEDSSISFEPSDWESIDFSKLNDVWAGFKKEVVKAVKFDRVEKDVAVGTESYSWNGTKYINVVDTDKLQYALEDVMYSLEEMGLPISAEDMEFETIEDTMELNYCVGDKYKAYELVNADNGYYMGFIETDKGVCFYQYDADLEEVYEILTTEKESDTEGTFCVELDGMMIEGGYEVDSKGWILSDINIMDMIEVDTFGLRNGAFILEGGLEYEGISVDVEVAAGKKEAYCDISLIVEGEAMTMSGGFEPIDCEEFDLPDDFVEGEEELNEWLGEILMENPELMELFVPSEDLEETEVPVDWD